MATESMLRDNNWSFYDFKVSVKYESKASPLLANIADQKGMVQPGVYDSYDIFGNNYHQLNDVYRFGRDEILLDTTSKQNFNKIGGYFILNTEKIRINLDSLRAIKFDYSNNITDNLFIINTSDIHRKLLLDFINNLLIKSIMNEKPKQLADTFVTKILETGKIQDEINMYIYDLIHGKISGFQENPEKVSKLISNIILNKLANINWELILKNKIEEKLKQFQTKLDTDKISTIIAKRIVDKINASITQDDIYNIIYPKLENFENETLPIISTQIAEEIFKLITSKLSTENIYNKIYPMWESVTNIDTVTVKVVSDSLSKIVTAKFFNSDEFIQELIPFVTKIDDTKTVKLGALSQEIIDNVLIPTTNNINARFANLNLTPDWGKIKPLITSSLTVIKTALKKPNVTIQSMSETLAKGIYAIMEKVIQKGFEKAIFRIQEIPANLVAETISIWATGRIEGAQPIINDKLIAKLNMVFDKFKAEDASELIAEIVKNKISTTINEENIYTYVLPVIEKIKQADVEKIAIKLADIITDLEIVSDKIDRNKLEEKLEIIVSNLIGKINTENVTDKLVSLLIENDLVQGLDGSLLKKVLSAKIYNLLIATAHNINAIENVEISIQKK